MPLKTYRVRVKLPVGTQEITVQADSVWNARMMIEAQYGPGSVFWGPVEVSS